MDSLDSDPVVFRFNHKIYKGEEVMKCQQVLKCSLVCSLLLVLVFLHSLQVSAATYSTEFPAYVPVSGGAFIETNVTTLGQATLVFPLQYQNATFGFAGSGSNICNLTNSTVNGYLYRTNGQQYPIRLVRLGTLEYQQASGTWAAVDTVDVLNTNITFIDQTAGDRQTDNYFYDKYGILELSVILILVLGFVSMLYVLLRKER